MACFGLKFVRRNRHVLGLNLLKAQFNLRKAIRLILLSLDRYKFVLGSVEAIEPTEVEYPRKTLQWHESPAPKGCETFLPHETSVQLGQG